jgi:hypothetical protein
MCVFFSLSRIFSFLNGLSRFQSQTKDFGVMDTNEFATIVVGKVISPKPPQYLTLGGFSTKMWILQWLPRTTAQGLIWSMAQKEPKPGTYGPM